MKIKDVQDKSDTNTNVVRSVWTYSHGQELFYKFISNFNNKLVKQLLSMTVSC